jgi:hypothetical protein
VFSALVLALVGLLLLGGLTTHAQDGTPVTGASTVPITPDPFECTVQRRTIDEFRTYTSPAGATPAASPSEFTLPQGPPADQATRDAVTATLRMALACFNAGDYLAFFGLVTDTYLQTAQAHGELSEESFAFFVATPPSVGSQRSVNTGCSTGCDHAR